MKLKRNGLRLSKSAYKTIQTKLNSKYLDEIHRRHVISNLMEICQILCALLPTGGRAETTS
jgi:hypothetical protein